MHDKEIINNIIEKSKKKIAISNFEKEKKIDKTFGIARIVATIIFCVSIGSGLVFATTNSDVVKELITNVKVTVTKDTSLSTEVSEEEKKESIKEEEAVKIANEYLTKIGINKDIIKIVKLEKVYYDNVIWKFTDNEEQLKRNVILDIDAKTGKVRNLVIKENEKKLNKKLNLSKDELIEISNEILNKYLPEKNGEYELVELVNDSYSIESIYYKKYGDLTNEGEQITINWNANTKDAYRVSMIENKFENNEVKLTKEQAIDIAVEKQTKLETEKTIFEIKADLRIKPINEVFYVRELAINKPDYDPNARYEVDDISRNVWVVVIGYDLLNNGTSTWGFSYFIDATTGEIVGGTYYDSLKTKSELFADTENSLIEK